MRRSTASLVLAGAIASGCGRSAPPPPDTGSAPAQPITGSERLAWDQRAADAAELAGYHYALYVDGARRELSDAACDSAIEVSAFACSAPLPPLDPGRHTLELAAFINDGGSLLESPRSTALSVIVAMAVARPAAAAPYMVTTMDGVHLRVRTMARGFVRPVDLAVLPDGRMLVVERSGTAHLIAGDDVRSATLPLENADIQKGGAVLSVAIDPQFDRTHAVYVLYAAAESDARTFRVARLREVNGTLSSPAVIFEGGAPSASAKATVRFGPDGKLYVALDAAAGEAEPLSSFNGKLLRFEPDGTTPRDQDGGSPLFSWTYVSPRGLDWQQGSGLLWIADATGGGRTTITAVGVDDATRVRGAARGRYSPAERLTLTGVAFYRGAAVPQFAGDLFAADAASGQILRMRIDSGSPLRVVGVERILEKGGGQMRAIAIAGDGIIYAVRGDALLAIDAADR